MTRFLWDTAVFVYAVGGPHRYREPCRALVAAAGTGKLRGEASADLVQEFCHQRLRRGLPRATALAQARDVAGLCRLHDVRAGDVRAALVLLEHHAQLTPRDAVFAAVAIARDVPAIVSPDRDFDGIPGLTRVDPLDEAALAKLAA